jgi:hypothetical protein
MAGVRQDYRFEILDAFSKGVAEKTGCGKTYSAADERR